MVNDSLNVFESFTGFIHVINDTINLQPVLDAITPFNNSLTVAMDYIHFVSYFIPIGTVLTIFGIYVAIQVYCFGISFLRTIWDILPIV